MRKREAEHFDRLRADFIWGVVGNVLYSASQFGVVIALAKLVHPEQVGEYAIGMAVSAPIALFANLQLRVLLTSELRELFSFGQYLTFRLVSLTVAVLLIASVAACVLPNWRLRTIAVLVGLGLALEFLGETYYGLMQKHGWLSRVSISLMIKGPFSLAAFCAALYVTRNLVWATLALAMGRLVILLAWDTRIDFASASIPDPARRHVENRLRWDPRAMLAILLSALPLGIISMLVSLNASIPRYFLEAHAGSSELGIYSVLLSLLTAGNLVVSAFGQSVFRPVAHACASADFFRLRAYIAGTVGLSLTLGTIFTLSGSSYGSRAIGFLFRPEYGERSDVLVWLMIAGTIGFISSGLGYVITASRRLVPQIPVLAAGVIVVTAASAVLVPGMGLMGAAYATMLAASTQLVGLGVILWGIDRELQAGRARQQIESVDVFKEMAEGESVKC